MFGLALLYLKYTFEIRLGVVGFDLFCEDGLLVEDLFCGRVDVGLGSCIYVCFLVVVHSSPGCSVVFGLNFLPQFIGVTSLPSHHHNAIAYFTSQSPGICKAIFPVIVQGQSDQTSGQYQTDNNNGSSTPTLIFLFLAIFGADNSNDTQKGQQ